MSMITPSISPKPAAHPDRALAQRIDRVAAIDHRRRLAGRPGACSGDHGTILVPLADGGQGSGPAENMGQAHLVSAGDKDHVAFLDHLYQRRVRGIRPFANPDIEDLTGTKPFEYVAIYREHVIRDAARRGDDADPWIGRCRAVEHPAKDVGIQVLVLGTTDGDKLAVWRGVNRHVHQGSPVRNPLTQHIGECIAIQTRFRALFDNPPKECLNVTLPAEKQGRLWV
ncbi:MAG: hypothetical protein U5K36_11805 [Roseovarius sp.]|nr:hypothetical protein [Roseovarius sp.]